MIKIKITLLTLIIVTNSILVTGCWNYREVDKLAIVAGAAVDKGINGQFKLTVEIVQLSGGKDTQIKSKTITAEGKTMFDAARNIISLAGRKLYWSHARIIILSKEIANLGVTKAIEWYNRDAETREDLNILISKGTSAKEIFEGQEATEDIKSFALGEMIKNQANLSKAPITDILTFDIESQTKGVSPIIPAVALKKINGQMAPQIMGTAIIKNDKLVGFLDGEETKSLIFIRDRIKGGLLIEEMKAKDVPTSISLEIFKNKTKVMPVVDDKDVKINLNIETTVSIDEINGTGNFIDEEGRMKLEQNAENTLKKQIESLILKVQSEYDADIFGFGAKIQGDKAQVWKSIEDDWQDVFKDLKVNVKTKVHIKNSAVLSKPIKEGD